MTDKLTKLSSSLSAAQQAGALNNISSNTLSAAVGQDLEAPENFKKYLMYGAAATTAATLLGLWLFGYLPWSRRQRGGSSDDSLSSSSEIEELDSRKKSRKSLQRHRNKRAGPATNDPNNQNSSNRKLKRSATENRLGGDASAGLLNESGQLSDVSVTGEAGAALKGAKTGAAVASGRQGKKRELYFDSNDEICFGDELEESESDYYGDKRRTVANKILIRGNEEDRKKIREEIQRQ